MLLIRWILVKIIQNFKIILSQIHENQIYYFALIATLTGCVNQIQVQSQAQNQSCQELYLTNPQSAINICQNELIQNPNNAELQFYLGMAYDLEQNYQKAFEWYTKSANQGDAEAQYNLGTMYHNGRGVKQDLNTAKQWLTKACENGYTEACQYR